MLQAACRNCKFHGTATGLSMQQLSLIHIWSVFSDLQNTAAPGPKYAVHFLGIALYHLVWAISLNGPAKTAAVNPPGTPALQQILRYA